MKLRKALPRCQSSAPLVVFTPLPPLANGIADYSAELLPELQKHVDLVVVVSDHAPHAVGPYRIIRLSDYLADGEQHAQSPHLYQLGNNADHVYMLPVLLRRPGIVVLHDVSVHHLIDQATLRYGDEQAYAALLELEYGGPGRLLASQFLSRHWRGRSFFYDMPMTREILARSRGAVVHSLYAQSKVVSQHAELPVALVPHHLSPSAIQINRRSTRELARAELRLPDDELLLVSLGFVTRAKQIDRTLRFMASQRALGRHWRYVIAGQDDPADFDVRGLVAQLGLGDVVEITGYIDEAAFFQWILASDIVVNLRYPTGGETSGSLIRALGVGACVVVNDIGPFMEYPDSVCAKVRFEAGAEDGHFFQVMNDLIEHPARRRRYAAAARSYIARTHALADSARKYADVIRLHASPPGAGCTHQNQASYWPRQSAETRMTALQTDPSSRLPLWAASACLPLATAGSGAMVIGASPLTLSLLSDLFGYPTGQVQVVSHPDQISPLPEPTTCALVLIELEQGRSDALAAWVCRVQPRIHLNGHLVLAIHGSQAPWSAAWRKTQLLHLEAAGFVVEFDTCARQQLSLALDPGSVADAASDAGQWVVRARKCSRFAVAARTP